MGLLKHVLLPFYAILHVYSFVSIVILDDRGSMSESAGELTADERHLVGTVGAFHAALLLACIAGIFFEHAHFRGVVTAMEAISQLLIGIDAIRLGVKYEIPISMGFFAIAGILIHSQEPGIFTVDRNKAKAR